MFILYTVYSVIVSDMLMHSMMYIFLSIMFMIYVSEPENDIYLQVTVYLSDVDIDTRNGEIVFKVWPLTGQLVTVNTGLLFTSTSAVSLSPTHPTP